jgi:hypothetical protein
MLRSAPRYRMGQRLTRFTLPPMANLVES